MLEAYAAYLEAVKQSSFDDVKNFTKSEEVSARYIKAVKASVAYTDFITVIKRMKKRF